MLERKEQIILITVENVERFVDRVRKEGTAVFQVHAGGARSETGQQPSRDDLVVGDLMLSFRSRTVLRDGTPVKLSSLEFTLLGYLMSNVGRVITYDRLLQEVWGCDHDTGGDALVKTAVCRLRKKLEVDGGRRHIDGVRGVGYILKELFNSDT